MQDFWFCKNSIITHMLKQFTERCWKLEAGTERKLVLICWQLIWKVHKGDLMFRYFFVALWLLLLKCLIVLLRQLNTNAHQYEKNDQLYCIPDWVLRTKLILIRSSQTLTLPNYFWSVFCVLAVFRTLEGHSTSSLIRPFEIEKKTIIRVNFEQFPDFRATLVQNFFFTVQTLMHSKTKSSASNFPALKIARDWLSCVHNSYWSDLQAFKTASDQTFAISKA